MKYDDDGGYAAEDDGGEWDQLQWEQWQWDQWKESVGQQSAQDAEWGSDAAQDQGNAEGCERGLHDEGEWTDHAGSLHADGWDYEAWQEERDEQQQWWWR